MPATKTHTMGDLLKIGRALDAVQTKKKVNKTQKVKCQQHLKAAVTSNVILKPLFAVKTDFYV